MKPNIFGIAGEVFTESYCRQNKIKYKKAKKEEDLTLGIDCYIGENKIPTDVKNTTDIFFLQILEDGIFNARHPFKKHSKATHYFFVDVDGTGQGKFIEHVEIKEKLLRDLIKDEENLNKLYTYLRFLDQTSYKKIGDNLAVAAFKIKKEVLKFCKSSVNVIYNEPVGGNTEVSFKLVMVKKKQTPSIQSINAIRNSIKEKLKETDSTKPEPQKENIIVIKI